MSDLIPRIYIACLASYNAGHLHGDWIEANQSEEELHEAIKTILAKSPVPNAEEWAIHDYENFGNLTINEFTSLDNISRWAEFIVEHGELGAEVLIYTGKDFDDAEQMMDDCYHGAYEDEADFVRSFLEEADPVPEKLEPYIDYDAMARDWFINDFLSNAIGIN